jgi:hypothetical protein
MAEYGKRDAMSLEPHYSRHVGAMTTEGLHAKSDIAAELAYRDARIAQLTKERELLAAEWRASEDTSLGYETRSAHRDELHRKLDALFSEPI